jgi:hypothetical protein
MRGARLRCSPNLPDHPALATSAIPRIDQLAGDPGVPRHADDWVRTLDNDQVDRYGLLFDALVARARAAGCQDGDVVCEVLSTWPYPLRRVMERHRLGRFCITQKADLARTDDVYRGENASPRDWIMIGNHDTAPVWRLADAWHGTAAGRERALRLAHRLATRADLRPRWARWLASDPRHLCHGMFAELFLGPARRVSVFFADLFGFKEIYNRPGVVDVDNWTLRLPATFEDDYARASRRGEALNVVLGTAIALVASPGVADVSLVRAMIELAQQSGPELDQELWSLMDAALP